MTTLWIVGRVYDDYDICHSDISIIGIYSSEELAIKACRTKDDFVGPVELDGIPDYSDGDWVGVYYPLNKELDEIIDNNDYS